MIEGTSDLIFFKLNREVLTTHLDVHVTFAMILSLVHVWQLNTKK